MKIIKTAWFLGFVMISTSLLSFISCNSQKKVIPTSNDLKKTENVKNKELNGAKIFKTSFLFKETRYPSKSEKSNKNDSIQFLENELDQLLLKYE